MKRQAPLTKFFGRAAEPQQKKRTEEAQGKLFTNRVKTRNYYVTCKNRDRLKKVVC